LERAFSYQSQTLEVELSCSLVGLGLEDRNARIGEGERGEDRNTGVEKVRIGTLKDEDVEVDEGEGEGEDVDVDVDEAEDEVEVEVEVEAEAVDVDEGEAVDVK